MAQTYKIKKGDTLGAIAKQYGVGLNDISGYRSGNPDLVYEGEDVTIGKPEKKESNSYVDEVKSQLSEDTTDDTKSSRDEDPYGLADIRTKISDTTKKRDDAFAELKDISTNTFNDEYEKRGLADKKARLSTLDSEITAEKQKRDDAIAKVKSNPGLSAAQMTGDIKKLADYQNDVINNKIAERNSVASEYNTDLAEIDKIVENAVKDKTLDYNYYTGDLTDLENQVGEYTKAYREDLKSETQADQFDRQLAQALEISKMNAEKKTGSSNLQLKSDPRTGEPLYWFDPDTGEITYINGEDNADSGSSFDQLDQAVETNNKIDNGARWYNPFSWANYF